MVVVLVALRMNIEMHVQASDMTASCGIRYYSKYKYPFPGTLVGGSLGNAILKPRQYPRIREYQVLSRITIG